MRDVQRSERRRAHPSDEPVRSARYREPVPLDRSGCERAKREIRLGLAVTRGLLLDLLATKDREGADAAMEHFLTNYMPLMGTKKGTRRSPPQSTGRGKRQLLHGTTRSVRDR